MGSDSQAFDREPGAIPGSGVHTGSSPVSTSSNTRVESTDLGVVLDTSKAASQAYILYVSFLAYCVISLITTSDKELVTNAPIVLPLINKNISANLFFALAPVIAISLFTYFEFFHCRLEGMLRDVRKDLGAHVSDHLYPSLLAFEESPETGFVRVIQRLVVQFSLWWLLPFVLSMFAFWTMKKHDLRSVIASVSLNLAGTALVVAFWLRHNPRLNYGRFLMIGLVLASSGIFLYEVQSITGLENPDSRIASGSAPSSGSDACPASGTAARPGLRALLTQWSALDIHGEDLSAVAELPSAHFEGGRLDEADFRGVKLNQAVMIGANIRRAKFQNASLFAALLDQSDLSSTNFGNSSLSTASFRGTCAKETQFNSASLAFAKFQRADLLQANFSNAQAAGADFTGVGGGGAEFTGANLTSSIFQSADLRGANLRGADLEHANLQGVNLEGANLQGADLSGADLSNAKNLTIQQVTSACTLFQTILDKPLKAQLAHSPLLKKPQSGADGKCLNQTALPGAKDTGISPGTGSIPAR